MSYTHYLDDEYLKLQDFVVALADTPTLEPPKLKVLNSYLMLLI